jgi:hypothetical protein
MMDKANSGWHTPVADSHPAARLLSAAAVRQQCQGLMAYVEAGDSPHFIWHEARLAATAAFVAEVIRERYADLKVPYHSRWRHFEAGGVDRWGALAREHGLDDKSAVDERARVRIDLVIPSVLLDAGAGAAWRYTERSTGQMLSRSEGLGVASLALFASGALSDNPAKPLQSDALALQAITAQQISDAFQMSTTNTMTGLAGRAALLANLGAVAAATPAVFGSPARLGNLYDYLKSHATEMRLDADFILTTLLRALGPMWPQRMTLEGVCLGDCWPHATLGIVPFHKLSQWLCYSLLEPLQEAGLTITNLGALTGLPEYRNGGLLLDMGVIEARDPTFHTRTLSVGEEAVIEWRAMTVVALDRIAVLVRAQLGVNAAQFPLACVLEGGTWAAGRKIAAIKRTGGAPPVNIASDGTVF